MMRRLFCAGLVLLGSATAAFAQYTQQRQDDLGTSPGMNAPVQQVSPLQTPAVQPPTITNNPDYSRQPIFVPSPGQLQQQGTPTPGQARPQAPGQPRQSATEQPRQSATEQRGRGAFTAPGVTRELTGERNEFQDFIWASTGQVLPLFGQNLFEAPSTFAPVENIPVTPDYVIGPGDELLVRAWGQIDVDYRAVVDRTGMINIPRVGSVAVAGVRYQDLTSHLRTAISRNFRNFELLVSMGQLRSVQIFVVGHARRPGAYTVSSLSTLVNAIFSAGGPAPHGSMRAIQLKRGNSVVTELDLYELLLAGDKSRDVPLLPGDVIYFPPVGALAAVAGSVNNAAIFELKGPTNVGRLLDLAGGLTTTAQARRATLERIDERKTRTVDQFALDYDGLKHNIKDGDLVSVLAISPRFENAVTLRGNVAEPLRYPWREGLRIRDLIPEKAALITPDYYRRQNLAVRFETVTQGQLSDNVRKLSDEINWDYAVIERLNPADLTTSLIPFNLGKAVLENDPANNLALKPGDVVTVFSKTDIGAPVQRRPIVVSLEGEFNFAGVYQGMAGETLRQLVTRVGGVTPQAYLFGAELTRESTRKNQEERLKQAILQFEQDLQRAAATRARNVTSAEEAASLKAEAEAQQATVVRLRTLKPTGRIVLELPENPSTADLPDVGLEDGDRLLIPHRPDMVSVFGTVFNESSFLYRPEKNVSDYLAQAGGPRKEADVRSIYVLRADGSVVSKRSTGFLVSSLDRMRPMPGDAIVVPEDLTRTTLTKDLKDWTQIFYQFGLGAAALRVIGRP
ncbi:MAG TPA: SLBB domain-containing protein [Burkholderiales bacterium]|nr:SLBB domain-containing protein [Burkholderiales bacterium]